MNIQLVYIIYKDGASENPGLNVSSDTDLCADIELTYLTEEQLNEHLQNDILSFRKDIVFDKKNEKDRLRSIAASYALKQALLNAGITAAEDKIRYNEKGKLFIDGCYVNLSHSGDMAVCVFDENECGVDLERISRFMKMTDKEGMIKRILSEGEIKYYEGLSRDDKAVYLCEKWTAKESYVKMTGEGIAEINNDIPGDVIINSVRISGEYIMSTCARRIYV